MAAKVTTLAFRELALPHHSGETVLPQPLERQTQKMAPVSLVSQTRFGGREGLYSRLRR